MSLSIEIKKKLDNFTLDIQLASNGKKNRNSWGIRLRKEYDFEKHCRNRDSGQWEDPDR